MSFKRYFKSLGPMLSGPGDLSFLNVDITNAISLGVTRSQNMLLLLCLLQYFTKSFLFVLILAASFSPTEQK